jgi:hypothetical protein
VGERGEGRGREGEGKGKGEEEEGPMFEIMNFCIITGTV